MVAVTHTRLDSSWSSCRTFCFLPFFFCPSFEISSTASSLTRPFLHRAVVVRPQNARLRQLGDANLAGHSSTCRRQNTLNSSVVFEHFDFCSLKFLVRDEPLVTSCLQLPKLLYKRQLTACLFEGTTGDHGRQGAFSDWGGFHDSRFDGGLVVRQLDFPFHRSRLEVVLLALRE